MSNVIEVYTNKETLNVRDMMVGKQKVLLRKSRTDVNRENVAVLSFLELMNSIPSGFIDNEKQGILVEYIKDNGIDRKSISRYAPLFPDKAIRNLVESEQQFLHKWTEEYHFDLELIQEACGRTITAIHQPSFEYTDSRSEERRERKESSEP